MKYVYIFLISFVFWEFGWVTYSTLYGLIIVFGVPNSIILNMIVKIFLVPFSLYFGFKVVTEELAKRAKNRKGE